MTERTKETDSVTRYLTSISEHVPMSTEETTQLVREAQDGNLESEHKLITNNLQLVVYIAKDLAGPSFGIDDLIAVGAVGLRNTIFKFDPDRGCTLSTYASWWINQAMRLYISKTRSTIRVPGSARRKAAEIAAVKAEHFTKFKRDITNAELEEYFDIDIRFINRYASMLTKEPIYLDQEIPGTDGRTESYLLVNKGPLPGHEKSKQETKEYLNTVMSDVLEDRERDILRARYGFDGDVMTLEEISHYYGLTRERIRQIQHLGLKKLRLAMDDLGKSFSADILNLFTGD